MPDAIYTRIQGESQTVIDLQRALVAIPALGPDNGDTKGEWAKAAYLQAYLQGLGISDIRRYDAPDSRVESGLRPNIAAVVPGVDSSRTFWVISHMDVVPVGDPSLWDSDAFDLRVDGDTLVGRGVEDNHQGLVASLLVAKAVMADKVTPPINLGLLFVSDEETGSKYGLTYVAANHAALFGPNDLFLVPDFGRPDGSMVEVAEKSILWLKVTVNGKQCHASAPDEGVNSLIGAAAFIIKTLKLPLIFNAKDPLFHPAYSTFEPTKKEANVENVNTIPGRDVFYVDCRVLPVYPLEDVLTEFGNLAREVEQTTGVSITFETVQAEQAAAALPLDAEIVTRIEGAISKVFGVKPKPQGIGGNTVAAVLRRAGHQAVVWGAWEPNAHQPNERSSIRRTLAEAEVMARVLFAK